MAKEISILLKETTSKALIEKAKEYEFDSIDEVILAGLNLIDQESKKAEALREAIIEGENSGPSSPFDPNEFKIEMNKKFGRINA